jgi:hypothetical protein
MLEVEQAAAASQATARLSEIRSKLGIEAPAAAETPSTQTAGAAGADGTTSEAPEAPAPETSPDTTEASG